MSDKPIQIEVDMESFGRLLQLLPSWWGEPWWEPEYAEVLPGIYAQIEPKITHVFKE